VHSPYDSSPCWHQRRCRHAGAISVMVVEFMIALLNIRNLLSINPLCRLGRSPRNDYSAKVLSWLCIGFITIIIISSKQYCSRNISKREVTTWVRVTDHRSEWRVLVNRVMNLRVPEKVGNFLIAERVTSSFSRLILFHGVYFRLDEVPL
jgi:hypothetical protein